MRKGRRTGLLILSIIFFTALGSAGTVFEDFESGTISDNLGGDLSAFEAEQNDSLIGNYLGRHYDSSDVDYFFDSQSSRDNLSLVFTASETSTNNYIFFGRQNNSGPLSVQFAIGRGTNSFSDKSDNNWDDFDNVVFPGEKYHLFIDNDYSRDKFNYTLSYLNGTEVLSQTNESFRSSVDYIDFFRFNNNLPSSETVRVDHFEGNQVTFDTSDSGSGGLTDGTLSTEVLQPDSGSTSVSQNSVFDFEVNVTCSNGTCEQVETYGFWQNETGTVSDLSLNGELYDSNSMDRAHDSQVKEKPNGEKYTCVPSKNSGYALINVTDPGNPSLLSSVSAPDGQACNPLKGDGYEDYWLTSDDNGINILDASNPESIEVSATANGGNWDNLNGVRQNGSVVWAADKNGQVRFGNITNTSNIAVLGSIDVPSGSVHDVAHWDTGGQAVLINVEDDSQGETNDYCKIDYWNESSNSFNSFPYDYTCHDIDGFDFLNRGEVAEDTGTLYVVRSVSGEEGHGMASVDIETDSTLDTIIDDVASVGMAKYPEKNPDYIIGVQSSGASTKGVHLVDISDPSNLDIISETSPDVTPSHDGSTFSKNGEDYFTVGVDGAVASEDGVQTYKVVENGTELVDLKDCPSGDPLCIESGNQPQTDSNLTKESYQPLWSLNGTEQGNYTVVSESTSSRTGVSNSSSQNVDVEVTSTTSEDTTPPTSSDNWSASGFVDKSSTVVGLTATDSGGGTVANISYRVNGGTYTTVQGDTAQVNINTVGDNTLEYYATDNYSNQETVNTESVKLQPLNYNRSVDVFKDGSYSDGSPVTWSVDADGNVTVNIADQTRSSAGDNQFNVFYNQFSSVWQINESVTFSFDATSAYSDSSSSNPYIKMGVTSESSPNSFTTTDFVGIEIRDGGFADTLDAIIYIDDFGTTYETPLNEGFSSLPGGTKPRKTTVRITPLQVFSNDSIQFRFSLTRENGTVLGNKTDVTPSNYVDLSNFNATGFVHRGHTEDDGDPSLYEFDSMAYEPYITENQPPTLNRNQYTCDYSGNINFVRCSSNDIGESLGYYVDASDLNSNFDTTEVEVRKDGTVIYSNTSTSNPVHFPNIDTFDTSDYNTTITVTDTDGASNTYYDFLSETEQAPALRIDRPNNGEIFNINETDNNADVEFNGEIDERSTEFNGKYELLLNGSIIKTVDFNSSAWTGNGEIDFNHVEELTINKYNFTVKVTNQENGNVWVGEEFTNVNSDPQVRIFTVSDLEEKPNFRLDNPSDNDILYYNPKNAGLNVSFTGLINSTFDGNGVVYVNDSSIGSFNVNSGETSYSKYSNLTNGSYEYRVDVVSDNTSNVYSSDTFNFDVVEVDEIPPKINIEDPLGNYGGDALVNTLPYNYYVNSEINGTSWLTVEYPNNYRENVTSGNSISPINQSYSDSFTLNNAEKTTGFYDVYAYVFSQKNNTYEEHEFQDFFYIAPGANFSNVIPEDNSVFNASNSSKVVDFNGTVNVEIPGNLSYKVKYPGNSNYTEINREEVNLYNDSFNFSYSHNFTNISFPNTVDRTEVSKEYDYKIVYENGRFNGDNSVGTYNTSVQSFKFEGDTIGLFESILNTIKDSLGKQGSILLALALSAGAGLLVATETENGFASVIATALVLTVFVVLGFIPLFKTIPGTVGSLALIGGLLYASSKIGKVIT